ncbi:MAG: serpin family protein [Candidatus Aminicenantes bacterium]|nr:serpin family protein [Candidatus Aminicenantes bacterium]NIM80894.1 serpin family protein [Candidatus Aminicenantes bacterium]NIN20278.1 serpin family protein [Candidatus Aminicenantes bacterium]NIN44057.1 serpin family protein [Candidatus Aminicenantes bacterium]NIN86867.1 serpin family protein [Candidatus Aminicenantes bacterium]
MNSNFSGFKGCVICLLTSLALAFFVSACQQGSNGESPIVEGNELKSPLARDTSPVYTENELRQLVSDNNTFAIELYHMIKDKGDNLFFSPYSISVALAMTYAGARNETETQIAATLNFNFPQDKLHSLFNALDLELASRKQSDTQEGDEGGKYLKLNIANAIWVQQDFPILDEYLDLLAVNYGAGIWLVDFQSNPEQARLTINDWVARETEDKIKDLLARGMIDILTRLVLTNVIYFNGAWALPFNKEYTQEEDFYLMDGGTVTVPMMRPEPGGYGENNEVHTAAVGPGYQAVELPYYGGEFSMLIVIPDMGTFATFEQQLDYSFIEEVVANLRQETIILKMPKFGYESEFDLSKTLSDMGMPNAFAGGAADFSGIDGRVGQLFISAVVHKAFISVDEEGTEAAAATAVIFTESAVEDPLQIFINRPFIYMIRDIKTGAILFLGRVKKPEPQA